MYSRVYLNEYKMTPNVFDELSDRRLIDTIIFTAHKHHDVLTQYILRHLAGLFVATPVEVKMPVGGRRGCRCLQSNGNNLYSVTGPAAGLNLSWDNVKERRLVYMGVLKCQYRQKC